MNMKEVNLYLLGNYPYYYGLLQQCRIVFDEKSDYLAAVKVQTRMEMVINPKKFDEFSVAEQAGLLIHEFRHLYNDHIKQTQKGTIEAISDKLGVDASQTRANISMDLEINPGISELVDSTKLGPLSGKDAKYRGIFPQDFKFHNGDSWVNYYAKLKSKFKQTKVIGQGGAGEGNGDKGENEGHQNHEYFKQSTSDSKLLDEIAANAAKRAKAVTAGSVPREIEKFLMEYEKGKALPWYLILRQFMQSLIDVKSVNTWKKVNRRFRGKLPGAKKLPRLKILVGIDMSGSMSDEDVKKCFNELDVMNNTGMAQIEVCYFDNKIHHREAYRKGFVAERVCSGGTSFIPVHELALEERFKGVVYLTDGYADFANKDDVSYKCLWVLNNNNVKPPYGNIAYMK